MRTVGKRSKAQKLHDKEEREKEKSKECSRCHEHPCKCDAGEKL